MLNLLPPTLLFLEVCLEDVSQCSLWSVWGDCNNAKYMSSVEKGWTRCVLESLSNFLM